MRSLALLLLAAAVAGPAAAQPSGNEVAPVTVVPNGPAAKLTASYPAANAEVTGGVLILKAAFDQPMDPLSFTAQGQGVDCLKDARLLADNKTFVLLCRTKLSTSYAVTLGAKGLGGKPAEAATLAFTTSAASPVNNVKAAMKAASLTDVDMPVVETPGLGPAGG